MIDKLLKVLFDVDPAMPVIHDSRTNSNIRTDKVKPEEVICVVYKNISGSVNTKTGTRVTNRMAVEFLTPVEFQIFEVNPVLMNEPKERCIGYMRKFVESYNDSADFVPVDNFTFTATWEKFDRNFVGIMVEFNAEENDVC